MTLLQRDRRRMMSTMSHDNDNHEGAEVIPLFHREAPVVVVAVPTRQRICDHMAIAVDDNEQIVTCRACGARLDPFVWIKGLGQHWERYTRRTSSALREVDEAEQRVAELKAEERRLRGRIDRLRGKAPTDVDANTGAVKREA